MLTGETEDTLKPGRRVDAVALRVFASEVVCSVRARTRSPARRSRHLLRAAQARRPPCDASDLPAPDGGGPVVGAPCRTLRMHFASSCMPTNGTGQAPPCLLQVRDGRSRPHGLWLTEGPNPNGAGRCRSWRACARPSQWRTCRPAAAASATRASACSRAPRWPRGARPAPSARRPVPGSAASAHAACAARDAWSGVRLPLVAALPMPLLTQGFCYRVRKLGAAGVGLLECEC